MSRYKLNELYNNSVAFSQAFTTKLYNVMNMGISNSNITSFAGYISSVVYGYFFDDVVAYSGEDTTEVKSIFIERFSYDILVNIAYWYRKYNEIKNLLTNQDINLMQSSKVTSSSQDSTKSASGSLQKTATTPTGVTADTSTDEIDITIGQDTHDGENVIDTTGFVDKYTNAQQKYANAGRVEGERSGTITREGSYEDLVNLLEKLPANFADEISEKLAKHFIFDYEHEGEYLDE